MLASQYLFWSQEVSGQDGVDLTAAVQGQGGIKFFFEVVFLSCFLSNLGFAQFGFRVVKSFSPIPLLFLEGGAGLSDAFNGRLAVDLNHVLLQDAKSDSLVCMLRMRGSSFAYGQIEEMFACKICMTCAQTCNFVYVWREFHAFKMSKICELCSLPFTSSSTLSQHKSKCHPETVRKNLKICSIEGCNKEFKKMDQMVNHLRQDHELLVEVKNFTFPSKKGNSFL